jgi:peptidoglycan-associated lipoprotein
MVENTVYFDFDSFIVKPQFQSLLEAQAKRLKANKAVKIYLSGHTDELGGREYNLALGQKRAEAVKRSLTILGIPESQMEAVSFGKEKPAIPGTTEAAGEKNRRVEISNRD